jgi:mRNA interferase MazF
MREYVPERGDLVWLTFHTKPDHEQAGRRPGLVLSPQSYNIRTSLFLVCPVISQVKGYPFEVPIPKGLAIQGVILSDQVRSLDWRARQAEFAGTLPGDMVDKVVEKLQILLGC